MQQEQLAYGKAIKIAYENFDKYNERIKDIRINGDMHDRLPGNINISFKDVDGSCLLLKLDEVRNMCIKWLCL